jgi:hypothetical protein
MTDGQKSLVSIYARDGAAGHRVLIESGEPVFIPWRRGRTMRREGRKAFRFYNAYLMPTEDGSREVIMRLHGNEEDARRGVNRPEHLRAYASTDPAYQRLMATRNNAETLNSTLKRPSRVVGPTASAASLRKRISLASRSA